MTIKRVYRCLQCDEIIGSTVVISSELHIGFLGRCNANSSLEDGESIYNMIQRHNMRAPLNDGCKISVTRPRYKVEEVHE